MSNTISCPKCKSEIEVTEVISSQLRAELTLEFEAQQRRAEHELEAKWNSERDELTKQALRRAQAQVAVELGDIQQQLTEAHNNLKTSQRAELELRQERRQLQQEREALELSVNRRIDEERSKIRDGAKKEAAEERLLRDAEKDKLIFDLTSQISELERKAHQGSQQTQGEVLEMHLESVLQMHFPHDTLVPVPKGIHGGDTLQIVHDVTGTECGTILWEFKRTKSWNDSWLPKLRNDQRSAKAQLAILVSIEMPKGTSTFNNIDGIWVTNCSCALGVAMALRSSLIELAAARRSQDGKQTKMELLYSYLSGSEFRHRVEGIVEAFSTLKEDLEAEKRAIQRAWAKREKQLASALAHTVGMYGDFQGVIGSALPAMKNLELPHYDSDGNVGQSSDQ